MKPIDIDADCKFLQDAKTNQQMAMYNLITSKRVLLSYGQRESNQIGTGRYQMLSGILE